MTVLEKMRELEEKCLVGGGGRYWESAVRKALEVDGLWLEFGVYQGWSLRRLSEATKGLVYGFDSFEGLPEGWNGHEAGWLSLGGKEPKFEEGNIRVVKGRFEETLEGFLAEHPERVAFLHVDCDIYASTEFVLRALEGRILGGTVVCFDELLGFPDYREEELRAWAEYLVRTGQEVRVLGLEKDQWGCWRVGFEVL